MKYILLLNIDNLSNCAIYMSGIFGTKSLGPQSNPFDSVYHFNDYKY